VAGVAAFGCDLAAAAGWYLAHAGFASLLAAAVVA